MPQLAAQKSSRPYGIQNAAANVDAVRRKYPNFHYSEDSIFLNGPGWWGDVRPRRRSYRIEIRYLDRNRNPFEYRPHVFVPFLFPRLWNPHGLEDGSLCLDFPWDPRWKRWIPSDGILVLLDWTALWLATYEYWVESGLTDSERVWLHPAI